MFISNRIVIQVYSIIAFTNFLIQQEGFYQFNDFTLNVNVHSTRRNPLSGASISRRAPVFYARQVLACVSRTVSFSGIGEAHIQ